MFIFPFFMFMLVWDITIILSYSLFNPREKNIVLRKFMFVFWFNKLWENEWFNPQNKTVKENKEIE